MAIAPSFLNGASCLGALCLADWACQHPKHNLKFSFISEMQVDEQPLASSSSGLQFFLHPVSMICILGD